MLGWIMPPPPAGILQHLMSPPQTFRKKIANNNFLEGRGEGKVEKKKGGAGDCVRRPHPPGGFRIPHSTNSLRLLCTTLFRLLFLLLRPLLPRFFVFFRGFHPFLPLHGFSSGSPAPTAVPPWRHGILWWILGKNSTRIVIFSEKRLSSPNFSL